MAKKNKLPVASTSMPVAVDKPYKPSPSEKKESEARERRYRAEDALRDLQRAECHRKDKSLMKDVKALAQEQIQALSKVK